MGGGDYLPARMARVDRLELVARSWPGSGTQLSPPEVYVAACLMVISLLTSGR